MSRNLLARMATAFILIPLILVLIWVPALRIGLIAFVAIIVAFASVEFSGFALKKGISLNTPLCVVLAVAITISAVWNNAAITAATLYAATVLAIVAQLARADASLSALATAVFGLAYVGWFGAHAALLHGVDATGPGLFTILLVAVILNDAGAYFVGKSIGKRKLAPVLSPNKTWEGAIGGFALTIIGMVLVRQFALSMHWQGFPDWSLPRYTLVGALLSVVAQAGDLTESALKRDAGVKDSGRLFPGHGGALDRCDGFLFAAPVLYYMMVF